MRQGIRKGLVIGMGVLAFAQAAPALGSGASTEPVRIGVLDMRAERIADQDSRVRVVHRQFLAAGEKAAGRQTPSGLDHGVVVATSAVRAVREIDRSVPIEIYSANAFRVSPDGRGYSMSYEGAMKALDWMHENGVRVVVTSYNTKNMGGATSLMNRAQNLGMTVVAGASNVAGAGKVWPAADARAISVADTTPGGSSLTLDASVQEWVKFGMRGDYADRARGGVVDDWGSSYSSAKVGGLAAYYVSRNPEATRDDVETALRTVARVQVQSHGRVKAVVAEIDDGDWTGRMRAAVQAGPRVTMASLTGSKGPSLSAEPGVPVMVASASQARGR